MPEQFKHSMLYYFYWFIVSMGSAGGVVFFLYQYLKPRLRMLITILPFTVYIFVLTLYREDIPSLLRAAVLTPLFFVLCTILFFYGTFKRKLMIVGVCYLCVLIIESVTGMLLLLLDIDYSRFYSLPFSDILYSDIIVNAFLILFSILLRPILKSNDTLGQEGDRTISVMVAAAAVAVALLLGFVIKLPQQNVAALIAGTLNIGMTVGCLLLIGYLLNRMAIVAEHEKEQALLRQNYALSLLRAEQVTVYQSEIDALYGGMDRELDNLCLHIRNHDIPSAIAATRQNISVIEQIKPTKSYHNNVADYLISKAKKQCEMSRISFVVECSLTEEIGIDEMDFCVVLSNILDNAVNAGKQSAEEGYIRLSLHRNNHILFIGCENSKGMEEPKKPKYRLGSFGLRNIKDTVEKYHGDVQINQDGECFFIGVLLYCNQ